MGFFTFLSTDLSVQKGPFYRNRSLKLCAGRPLCSMPHLSPESFGEEILLDFPKCGAGIIFHPLTLIGQSQMKVRALLVFIK